MASKQEVILKRIVGIVACGVFELSLLRPFRRSTIRSYRSTETLRVENSKIEPQFFRLYLKSKSKNVLH